jgi:hypothetical protein
MRRIDPRLHLEPLVAQLDAQALATVDGNVLVDTLFRPARGAEPLLEIRGQRPVDEPAKFGCMGQHDIAPLA